MMWNRKSNLGIAWPCHTIQIILSERFATSNIIKIWPNNQRKLHSPILNEDRTVHTRDLLAGSKETSNQLAWIEHSICSSSSCNSGTCGNRYTATHLYVNMVYRLISHIGMLTGPKVYWPWTAARVLCEKMCALHVRCMCAPCIIGVDMTASCTGDMADRPATWCTNLRGKDLSICSTVTATQITTPIYLAFFCTLVR